MVSIYILLGSACTTVCGPDKGQQNLVDRLGGMEHHLIARVEGGAVRLNVVGVGLMAFGPAKM